jgi:2-oxoglutarate dehydrogenase complex dehydrogenase (E1) component-like enzyme
MIVAMDSLFRACASVQIEDVVIGMPHRGRSNLLAVLLRYPPASLFAKMRGESLLPSGVIGDDDVLSHIAQSVALDSTYGKPLRVTLLHNPSHLEVCESSLM